MSAASPNDPQEFLRPPAGQTPPWLRSASPHENGLVETITTTGAVEVVGESGDHYWIAGKNVLGEPQEAALGTVYRFSGAGKGRYALVLDPASERWRMDAGSEVLPEEARAPLAEMPEPETLPDLTDALQPEETTRKADLEVLQATEAEADADQKLAAYIDENQEALRTALEDLKHTGFSTEALEARLQSEAGDGEPDMREALDAPPPPSGVDRLLTMAHEAVERQEQAAAQQPAAAPAAPEPAPVLPPHRTGRMGGKKRAAAAAPAAPTAIATVEPVPQVTIPTLDESHLRLSPPRPQVGRLLVDGAAVYRLLKLQTEFMQVMIGLIEPIFLAPEEENQEG